MNKGGWKFSTPLDSLKIAAGDLAAAALFVTGVAYTFSPLAATLGLLWGAAFAVKDTLLVKLPLYQKFIFRNLKQVSEDSPIAKISADLGQKLGLPAAPKIYTGQRKHIARLMLPLGLGFLLPEKNVPLIFGAYLGTNSIVTTEAALERGKNPEQLKFVTAHELSHLKTDPLSLDNVAAPFVHGATRALFWGSLVTGALSLLGVNVAPELILNPKIAAENMFLAVDFTMVGLGLARGAASLGLNFASRAVETRADRNAIYLTRDPKTAKAALVTLDADHDEGSGLNSHPSFSKRFKDIDQAWEKASRYPLPAPEAAQSRPSSAPDYTPAQ